MGARSTSRLVAGSIVLTLVVAACSSAGSTPSGAPTARPAAGPETVAMGAFHKVDGEATGTAALLHLTDGSYEVSFENFSVAAIEHLDVIFVSNADVTKTTDVDPTAILDLGPVKARTGMQEFPVPSAMSANAMGYHTVVLWDTIMKHAIAAAPLK